MMRCVRYIVRLLGQSPESSRAPERVFDSIPVDALGQTRRQAVSERLPPLRELFVTDTWIGLEPKPSGRRGGRR